ncbi:MAG: glycosyltransferase family 39 protein [Bacteroidota bacterium]
MPLQILEFYKSINKKSQIKIQDGVFIILLISAFLFLGYQQILFLRPQGIHFMRQTDSASFVLNYYNNGFNFFKPALFSLKNIDGNAACEFPIVYYITSFFYLILGEKEFLLRMFHLLIVSAGIFCLYKLAFELLKDYLYALFISFFLFTSTVFCYYSCNFLPDPAALGFVFIGWYSFILHYKNGEKRSLLIGFIFFTLAGLIKITYLINPLTILVLSFIELFVLKSAIKNLNALFKRRLAYGLFSILIVIGWNIYVMYYNQIYESHSFITAALPMWNLSANEIAAIWNLMCNNYWYPKYFSFTSFHLLFVLIPFQIIFFKKSDKPVSLITLILFLGSLAYFILFYSQFRDHDYYFMAFFPLCIFIILNGISIVKNLTSNFYVHSVFKLMLLVIVVSGTNYARMKLAERYRDNIDEFSKIGVSLADISPELEKLKIPQDSKFLVVPDKTPNGGLYFLNRKGWSFGEYQSFSADTINAYQQKGAEYILLSIKDEKLFSTVRDVAEPIYEQNGVTILKLNK